MKGLLRLRFTRFVLVGWIGFVVQTLAFFLFTSAGHVSWFVATLIAAEVAIAHNFLWHERWTWRAQLCSSRDVTLRARVARFVRFNLTSAAFAIVGNEAIMAAVIWGFGMPPLVANVVATALLGVVSFVAADRWTFSPVAS